MSLMRLVAGMIGCWFLLAGPVTARAESPPDPLRLVPDVADVVIQVKSPRRIAETVTQHELFQQVQQLAPVRELLDTTSYRRAYQLVAYFEKQLGAPCPELLDRLAGGGAVLATKLGTEPAPVLLVIQGNDEKLMRRFADLGLQLIEQELARREAKERPIKTMIHGIEAIHFGKEFHAAVAGSALLVSNNEDALRLALDLQSGGGKTSMAHLQALANAHKLLPADPLASLWLNLETVHKEPKAKDVFASGRDPILTVLFGGWLDAARRSSFLCMSLQGEPGGFSLALRLPGGRESKGAEQAVHVPPSGDASVAPLLEPRGVVLSHSYYHDVGKFWEDRAKIFTPEQVNSLEELDKNSALVLAGQRLSGLLTKAGARHRFVAANQRETGYTRKPKQPLPGFAIVAELRDVEEFSKTMKTVLRGVALLAGSQFKLKLVDEKHGNRKIVAYRFTEDAQVEQDPQDIRFNFSPCFVNVGKYFVASSTAGLCHELIDLLEKEAKQQPASQTPAAMRTMLYAAGAADSLQIGEDTLIAQTILSRAATLDEARAEAKALIALVRRLGGLRIETRYEGNQFRAVARLKLTP
jgi:hypothetical protein